MGQQLKQTLKGECLKDYQTNTYINAATLRSDREKGEGQRRQF